MKKNQIKYIIQVKPTFTQRIGFALMALIGGAIGGITAITYISNKAKAKSKVTSFKEFCDRVAKEEANKE